MKIDRCVCCGALIPEGGWVCLRCAARRTCCLTCAQHDKGFCTVEQRAIFDAATHRCKHYKEKEDKPC